MFTSPSSAVQFSSRLFLLSRQDFLDVSEKLVAQNEEEKISDQPWTIWCGVRLEDKALTEGASDCNVIGITDSTQVSLFHLKPKLDLRSGIDSVLTRDIEQLNQQKKRSIVMGGRTYNSSLTEASKLLYEEIKTSLIKNKMWEKTTRIWGRNNREESGYTDTLYDARRDAWFIHLGLPSEKVSFPDLIFGLFGLKQTQAKPQAVLDEKTLKRVFSDVFIAEGDQLITPDDEDYQKTIDGIIDRN